MSQLRHRVADQLIVMLPGGRSARSDVGQAPREGVPYSPADDGRQHS